MAESGSLYEGIISIVVEDNDAPGQVRAMLERLASVLAGADSLPVADIGGKLTAGLSDGLLKVDATIGLLKSSLNGLGEAMAAIGRLAPGEHTMKTAGMYDDMERTANAAHALIDVLQRLRAVSGENFNLAATTDVATLEERARAASRANPIGASAAVDANGDGEAAHRAEIEKTAQARRAANRDELTDEQRLIDEEMAAWQRASNERVRQAREAADARLEQEKRRVDPNQVEAIDDPRFVTSTGQLDANARRSLYGTPNGGPGTPTGSQLMAGLYTQAGDQWQAEGNSLAGPKSNYRAYEAADLGVQLATRALEGLARKAEQEGLSLDPEELSALTDRLLAAQKRLNSATESRAGVLERQATEAVRYNVDTSGVDPNASGRLQKLQLDQATAQAIHDRMVADEASHSQADVVQARIKVRSTTEAVASQVDRERAIAQKQADDAALEAAQVKPSFAAVDDTASVNVQRLQVAQAIAEAQQATLKAMGPGLTTETEIQLARLKVLRAQQQLAAALETERQKASADGGSGGFLSGMFGNYHGSGGGGEGGEGGLKPLEGVEELARQAGFAFKYYAFYQVFYAGQQILKGVMDATKEYQTAVEELSIAMGTNREVAGGFADQYVKIGATLGASPTTAIEGATQYLRSFRDANGDVVRSAGGVGATLAGQTSLIEGPTAVEGTLQSLVGLGKSYDLTASGTSNLYGRAIQIAQSYGQGNAGDLLAGTAQIGAIGANAGFTPDQLMQGIAAASQASGETANAVAGNITRFLGADPKTRDALLQSKGIDTINQDVAHQMAQLSSMLKEMPAEERKALLETLGGARSSNTLIPFLQGVLPADQAATVGSKLPDAAELADEKLKSLGGALTALTANIQDLFTAMAEGGIGTIMSVTLEALNGFINGITALFQAFNRINGPTRDIVTTVLLLTAALRAAAALKGEDSVAAMLRNMGANGPFAKAFGLNTPAAAPIPIATAADEAALMSGAVPSPAANAAVAEAEREAAQAAAATAVAETATAAAAAQERLAAAQAVAATASSEEAGAQEVLGAAQEMAAAAAQQQAAATTAQQQAAAESMVANAEANLRQATTAAESAAASTLQAEANLAAATSAAEAAAAEAALAVANAGGAAGGAAGAAGGVRGFLGRLRGGGGAAAATEGAVVGETAVAGEAAVGGAAVAEGTAAASTGLAGLAAGAASAAVAMAPLIAIMGALYAIGKGNSFATQVESDQTQFAAATQDYNSIVDSGDPEKLRTLQETLKGRGEAIEKSNKDGGFGRWVSDTFMHKDNGWKVDEKGNLINPGPSFSKYGPINQPLDTDSAVYRESQTKQNEEQQKKTAEALAEAEKRQKELESINSRSATQTVFGDDYSQIGRGVDAIKQQGVGFGASGKMLQEIIQRYGKMGTDHGALSSTGTDMLLQALSPAAGSGLGDLINNQMQQVSKLLDPLAQSKGYEGIVARAQELLALARRSNNQQAIDKASDILRSTYAAADQSLVSNAQAKINSIRELQGITPKSLDQIKGILTSTIKKVAGRDDVSSLVSLLNGVNKAFIDKMVKDLNAEITAVKAMQDNLDKAAALAAASAAVLDSAITGAGSTSAAERAISDAGPADKAAAAAKAKADANKQKAKDDQRILDNITKATTIAAPSGSDFKDPKASTAKKGPTGDEIAIAKIESEEIPGDPISAANTALRVAQYQLAHAHGDMQKYYQAVKAVNDAQYQLAQAHKDSAVAAAQAGAISGDPLSEARANLKVAQLQLAAAVGTAAYYQALKGLHDAQYQLAQAEMEKANNAAMLGIDMTDPLAVAREKVREAAAKLAQDKARGADTTADQVALKQAQNDAAKTAFDQQFNDARTNYDLHRMSLSAYMSYLQAQHDYLTAVKHKTRDQVDELNQVDQALKSLTDSMDGQFNLGNIKVPSPYEVRRSMAGGAGATTTQNVTITINGSDLNAVRGVLGDYLGQGVMQTTGTSTRKV